MSDDGEFKNEMNIRGSKAVADKADMGFVMTRVTDKMWNSVVPNLRIAVNRGDLPAELLSDEKKKPTHVLDIYKMRRGRFKNVRVWTNLDLGNGYRKDLFITNADNLPVDWKVVLLDGYRTILVDHESEENK